MISDERRLHPAATVIEAIRHARGAAVGMIAVIASQGIARGALIVAALLVVASAAAILQWRTTRYAVVDGALRLRTGVFSRKEQSIPASRISALDTSRGVLQRIFGVVALQVQTAGGGKEAELRLRAISFAEAERLREALGHRAGASTDPSAEPGGSHTGAAAQGTTAGSTVGFPTFSSPSRVAGDPAPVVYAMTTKQLFTAALTSPSIAVASAAAAAIFSLGHDALPERLERQLADSLTDLTVQAIAVLAVIALVVAVTLSVAGFVVLYGGFKVTRDDRRLRVRRGLLTERASTIPIDRIHAVRLVETPLRQMLGYVSIEVEVAGYAGQDEVARTIVPLLKRTDVAALLPELVPGISEPSTPLEPVPARAHRRYLTVPLLLSLPVAVALLALPIGAWRLAALLPVLLAVLFGLAAARTAGWQVESNTLTLRWRSLARITVLADTRRLQRRSTSTTPFQRRGALATFAVRLSNARVARIKHLDDAVANELLRRADPV